MERERRASLAGVSLEEDNNELELRLEWQFKHFLMDKREITNKVCKSENDWVEASLVLCVVFYRVSLSRSLKRSGAE